MAEPLKPQETMEMLVGLTKAQIDYNLNLIARDKSMKAHSWQLRMDYIIGVQKVLNKVRFEVSTHIS